MTNYIREFISFKKPLQLDSNFSTILKKYNIQTGPLNEGDYQNYENGIYIKATQKWAVLIGDEKTVKALEEDLRKI